ncbi:tape measure protein [Lancefieldella parvula]|uniref:tape measure protein n=1 Tax=Lancefieldella parvula TaxID=1382 RepID=UPI0028D778B5|nr:tape measure protein [Lancefieldella parvula]
MAGTVVRGSVLLTPKFDNLGANVKRALGSGYKSAVSVHTNAGRQAAQNYASGFGGATGAIMGIVSSVTSRALDAISGSIASAVNRVDTIANFPKIMQSVGYSADEARATIERLSTGIDGLPTSLDAIVGSVQKIAPVSGSLATATDVALAFNNALLAGGKSQEIMNSAFEQYSQMLSTGRVDMQSWKILAQAMPGQLNQIAKALLGANANQADLYKAMQSGAITFDQFNNAIVSLNNEGLPGYASFAEQARISTESIGTAWTNVQNRINKAVAKIIDHIGQANIAGAINDFSSSFSGIADTIITYLDPVISTVGSFMDQLQNNGAITSFGDALNALKDVFDSTIGLIGDLITTFTGLDGSENTSRSAADLLKSAVDGVKSAVELARDAVQGLRDNLTVVAPVIVAVATALIAYETIKAVRSIADDFGLLKSAASLAFDAIKGGEGVLSTLSVFGELVGEGGTLASVFGTISTAISGVGTSLLALVGSIPVIGWIAVAVVALGAVFTWLWNTNEDFRNAVIGIWDSICSAISGAVDSIVGFFTTTLPTAFTQFVQFVQGIPAAVGQFIQELPSMVLYALTFAVVFLFGLGAQLAQLAVQIGSEFVQNVVNFFTVDLPSAFAQFVLFVSTIPEQVQTALATLLVNIALWAVDMAAKASEAADGFLRGVTDGLNAAVDFVKSVPDKIKSFFSNAGDWLVNSGKALLDGFAKGIRNAVNAVTSAASDALGAVRKLFPFSPAKKGPFSGHGYTTYSGRALMRDFAKGIKGSSALAETEAMSALSSVHDVFSNARPLSFSAVADANANGIYRAAFELDSRQQRANATTLADIYDFMRNGELGQVIDENSNNIGDRDFARAVQKAVKTNA